MLMAKEYSLYSVVDVKKNGEEENKKNYNLKKLLKTKLTVDPNARIEK